MIKYISILLIFFSCKTVQPIVNNAARSNIVAIPYVVTWVCKNEKFVLNYKLQKNKTNNKSGWTTIGTVLPKNLPDSNKYTYILPKTSIANYYRVIANCTKGTFNTTSIYLLNTTIK